MDGWRGLFEGRGILNNKLDSTVSLLYGVQLIVQFRKKNFSERVINRYESVKNRSGNNSNGVVR